MKKIMVPLLAVIFGLALFGCGNSSISDVTIESAPGMTVAMIRAENEGVMNMTKYIKDVGAYLNECGYFENHSPHAITVYWSWENGKGDWGTGFIIDPEAGIEETDTISIVEFKPIEKTASLLYTGSYMGLPKAYGAFMKWNEDNDHEYFYPTFEEYLNDPSEVSASELQTRIWAGIK